MILLAYWRSGLTQYPLKVSFTGSNPVAMTRIEIFDEIIQKNSKKIFTILKKLYNINKYEKICTKVNILAVSQHAISCIT